MTMTNINILRKQFIIYTYITVNLLKAGGREAAGGVRAADFGTGYSTRVLSASARKEKDTFTPYDKLPPEMKNQISKREYDALQVRGSEDETEGAADGALLPAIVFSFSKKKCEEIADNLRVMNLTSTKEKSEVKRVLGLAMSRLSEQDRKLPQVARISGQLHHYSVYLYTHSIQTVFINMLCLCVCMCLLCAEMLSRGLGVHHSGLLPVLRECVELLFACSAVKVLIATETFAMGVNMPAKCVVFNVSAVQ